MRLRQICLVAPQLEPVISDIAAIMGLSVCYRDGNVAKYGLENALLPVDTILLEVVAPFQPRHRGGAFHRKDRRPRRLHGDLLLRRSRRTRQACQGDGRAHRQRDHHAPYHGVQLHPRDCRAAFIEFNHTAGSDDVLGTYPPAGPDWQKSIRKDVTQALTGVEMQSPEPQGLAEHWGKIIGVAAGKKRQRRARAETAELQIPLRQGRERDHERADVQGRRRREGARCRKGEGYAVSGDAFDLGGVTFKLVA